VTVAFALIVSGCGGGTITVTRTVVRTAAADPSHPAPRPRLISARTPVEGMLDEFVPRDATPTGVMPLRATPRIPEQAVVLWQRDYGMAFPYKQSAFDLWQRGRTWWRRVYTSSADEGRSGAEHMSASSADVTGDDHPDLLLFVYTDGSGGGGIYELFATEDGKLRPLWSARTTHDTDEVFFRDHSLVTYQAIRSSKTTSSPHCCYSRWLRLVRRWPHERLVVISRSITGPPRERPYS
jgi:hypothetical protein